MTLTYLLTVTDSQGLETTHEVAVNIEGTNDNPTLSGTTADADEDGDAITIDLSLLGDDVDSENDGTNLTYDIVGIEVEEGTASIEGTELSFDPSDDFQDLAVNETREVTVQIRATDEQEGTSSIQDVTITVTGTNDAPIVSLTGSDSDAVTVDEATGVETSGTLTVTDVDVLDTVSVVVTSVGEGGDVSGIDNDDLLAMLTVDTDNIIDNLSLIHI